MTEKEVMGLNRGDIIYDKNNMPLVFMSRCKMLKWGKSNWRIGVSVKLIDGLDYKNSYGSISKYKWGNGTELEIEELKKTI